MLPARQLFSIQKGSGSTQKHCASSPRHHFDPFRPILTPVLAYVVHCDPILTYITLFWPYFDRISALFLPIVAHVDPLVSRFEPKGPKKGPKGPKGAKSAQNTVNNARKLARKAKISTLGGTIMRVAGPCGSILV